MSDGFDERYEFDEDEEEEPSQSSRRWIQPLVLSIAILLVLALAGVPVLRIFALLQDEDDGLSVDEQARRNTALLFAEAVLERRSTSRAEPFIIPELHEPVNDVIGHLQSQEPSALDGTSASVSRVSCSQVLLDGDACFESTLARDDGPPLVTIQYGVGIVNNSAVVVALARPGIYVYVTRRGFG